MIGTLHIKNIGIIDDLSIDLNEGFNVLTGETGAGKTLIIGSLKILAGDRFSKEMIRKGEKFSFIEMLLYKDDEEIIVSREVNLSGKNMCKINGRMVTVNELKEFMKNVVDIHGQKDNQLILEQKSHIMFLDEYIGDNVLILKDSYNQKYKEYRKIKDEIARNYGDDKEKQRKLDLLRYQINEIDEAELKKGEEESVEEKLKMMQNSELISNNLEETNYLLSENVLSSLETAMKKMDKISEYNTIYEDMKNRIESSFYDLEEVERELSSNRDENYFDINEFNELERRFDLIQDLKRKYGNNIEEILEYRKEIEKEIFDIENLEEYVDKLKRDSLKLEKEMLDLANKMTQIREKESKKLSKEITDELKDLEMKYSEFSVKIESKDGFEKDGLDKIEFMIKTNLGEESKSLIKIASGGEMSRIMLAIKKVLATVDRVPVLVFDEIDTGISGIAAKKVGEKMKEISKTHQVICVTHLATIAAKGNYNYFIHKETENEKTKTKIELLNEEETIKEIARISTGEITDISLKHAKELRKDNDYLSRLDKSLKQIEQGKVVVKTIEELEKLGATS
ncbi:MAG: DNA repair protein RecN [Clostridia bacterium]|nr:DNA repair protein RecN [Clostridia bacterium]